MTAGCTRTPASLISGADVAESKQRACNMNPQCESSAFCPPISRSKSVRSGTRRQGDTHAQSQSVLSTTRKADSLFFGANSCSPAERPSGRAARSMCGGSCAVQTGRPCDTCRISSAMPHGQERNKNSYREKSADALISAVQAWEKEASVIQVGLGLSSHHSRTV